MVRFVMLMGFPFLYFHLFACACRMRREGMPIFGIHEKRSSICLGKKENICLELSQ